MRLTRRQLGTAALLSLAGGATSPLLASAAPIRQLHSGWQVLGDSRFAASRALAERLAPGVWLDVREDAAALWYQQLRQRLSASHAIIGVTTAADLTILQGLARENGWRLAWQQRIDAAVLVQWMMQG